MKTINTTIEQVSNYSSTLILKIVILHSKRGFLKQSRTVVLVPQNDNSLISLLQVGYLQDELAVSRPLDLSCI